MPTAGEESRQSATPSVMLVVVGEQVEATDLAAAWPGAIGLLSAGQGSVTATQTYLDITQGARVSSSLYEEREPPLLLPRMPPAAWSEVRERAAGAPGDLVPGLLAETLLDAGIPVQIASERGQAQIAAFDLDGRARLRPECAVGDCPGLTVVQTSLKGLRRLVRHVSGDDLLIALEAPPPPKHEPLALAFYGVGFESGTLTSSTTRADGLVTATDLAPTIIERFGLEPPSAMEGFAIETRAGRDAGELERFEERISEIVPRRGAVIWANLAIWALLALAAVLATRGRAASTALPILGVSVLLLPTVLLLCGELWPSEPVERLAVGVGAPALAVALLAAMSRYAAVAIACGLTLFSHAAAVIGGSMILSLAGPSPGSGVRFYGIGNELEATLAVQLVLGVGAAMVIWQDSARRRATPALRDDQITAALAFGAAGLVATAVFAASPFGADVGAAIVIPAGVAAAIGVVLRLSARAAAALIVGGVALLLGALIVVDALTGGDSHFARSVLGAEDAGALGDVFERRLRLAGRSIESYVGTPVLWIVLLLTVTGIKLRGSIANWFTGRHAALAGFVGAVAAGAVGTLANDSGLLLWIVAVLNAAAFAAVAWAEHERSGPQNL